MSDADTLTWFVSDRLWISAISVADASTGIDSYRSSASEMLDDSIVAAIVTMARKTTRAANNRRTFAIMSDPMSENLRPEVGEE
jgi:hypothetical protein